MNVNPTRPHLITVARTASRLALLLSLLFGRSSEAAGPAPEKPTDGKTMRVLFIGNSLTAANNLPRMVQALAKASGKSLEVDDVTYGGYSLEDHWNNGDALDTIARGKWDYVVLQHGPSSLPESRVELRTWTKKFAPKIRAAGAEPALYMVWPSPDRINYYDDVREAYSLAAQDVNGMFIPAGEALRAAQKKGVKARLLSFDGFHPSEAGTYAVALSVYGMIFQQSPVGLPAKLPGVISLAPEVAKGLQEAAAEANQKFGRRK
jgi:lysophospholipase L1-like esterase